MTQQERIASCGTMDIFIAVDGKKYYKTEKGDGCFPRPQDSLPDKIVFFFDIQFCSALLK